MNYLLPKRGILSMHASANEGKDRTWLSVAVGFLSFSVPVHGSTSMMQLLVGPSSKTAFS